MSAHHLLRRQYIIFLILVLLFCFLYYHRCAINLQSSVLPTTSAPLPNPPSQDTIRAQLNKFYNSIHSTYTPPNRWRDVKNNQTYYFPRLNLFFTGIPKTGCSHWKESLLIGEGALTSRLSYLPDVHQAVSYKYRIPVSSKYWTKSGEERMEKAASLLALRNPWVRAMSAYRQKLSNEKTQGNDLPHLKYYILRAMRGIPAVKTTEELNNFTGEPTLEEFVRYMVTKKHPVNALLSDIHFMPQHEFISPSKVRYDYIIPMEFVDPISEEFFKETNLDIHLPPSYDEQNDPRLQTSAVRAKELFSKLDPELIDMFYSVYKKDFMLLNYSNFTDPLFPLPLLT